MPDIFNPQIDKITEREVVYDFISRISFGRTHNVGDIYSTYVNQDSSALITVANQNQSQIEYTLSGTKLVDYLISLSLIPNGISNIASINKQLKCKIINIEGVQNGLARDNGKLLYGSSEYVYPSITIEHNYTIACVYFTSNVSEDLSDLLIRTVLSSNKIKYELPMESNFPNDDSLVFIYY